MTSINVLSWWYIIAFFIILGLLLMNCKQRQTKTSYYLVFAYLTLIAGLRKGYVDTPLYRRSFEVLDVSSVFSWDTLKSLKSPGFGIFQGIIKLITDNSQIFILACALVTIGFYVYGMKKYSIDPVLGIFVMVTCGCYIDSMNGIRQSLVAAFLFFCLPKFIEEKKFAKYCVVVLIASTVHSTCLIFIPLYFICSFKPWSKWTVFLSIGFCFYALLFTTSFGNSITAILETTLNASYASSFDGSREGVNIIRVFVAAVPVALAFLTRDNPVKEGFPAYKVFFNLSVVNLVTWVAAAKILYFYRLAYYTTPFMIVDLCYEIYAIREQKTKQLVIVCACVLFLAFCFYDLSGSTFFYSYLNLPSYYQ